MIVEGDQVTHLRVYGDAGGGRPVAIGWEIWRGLFVWQPDVALWFAAVGLVFLVKVIVRIVWLAN